MEALDGTLNFTLSSVFPPTPPSSTSSPILVDAAHWPSTSTASWSDGGGAAWVLDGLPDAKPDMTELLQASLLTELPILNAESTHFLLDGGADAALAATPGPPPLAAPAAPAAPWPPQWSYCAYCAAGEAPVHGNGLQSLQGMQSLQQPQQLYPQQGIFYDPYFPSPMTTPFSEGVGLVYVDNPGLSQGMVHPLPQSAPQLLPQSAPQAAPQPQPHPQPPPLSPSRDLEESVTAEGDLCWDAPMPVEASSSATTTTPAAGATATVGGTDASETLTVKAEQQGKASKRVRLTSSRDPLLGAK